MGDKFDPTYNTCNYHIKRYRNQNNQLITILYVEEPGWNGILCRNTLKLRILIFRVRKIMRTYK